VHIQLHPGIVSPQYHSYCLVTCPHKTEDDDTFNISTKCNFTVKFAPYGDHML